MVYYSRGFAFFCPYHKRNKLIWDILELNEKILKPVRKFVPPIGGIDISPIVVIIILQIIDSIIWGL
ncbi:MAG: YggT family protein [Desulfurobacteriaceae bacterium]